MTEVGNDLGIVVGTDGSACANAAVRRAAREAAIRDMPVTLAHVNWVWIGTPTETKGPKRSASASPAGKSATPTWR